MKNNPSSKKIENFKKAFVELQKSCEAPITENRDLAGIIKSFEFTYELGWNALKEYLKNQGIESSTPRDVLSKAFMSKIIKTEDIWLQIMKDRNLTSHTYDFSFAQSMVNRIKNSYLSEFESLLKIF